MEEKVCRMGKGREGERRFGSGEAEEGMLLQGVSRGLSPALRAALLTTNLLIKSVFLCDRLLFYFMHPSRACWVPLPIPPPP